MMMPNHWLAYIDPGTMQNVFGALAPILGALAAAVAVLAWPFRFVYHRVKGQYRQLSRAGRRIVWVTTLFVVGGGAAGVFAMFSSGQGTVSVTRDRSANFERVIVLGMDGLDPRIVEEMIASGDLPNFSKLASVGSYSRLQTSNPPESPVAWSTIATGTSPGEHGIFDFLHRQPQSYIPYLSLRNSVSGLLGTRYRKARQRDGFWKYTSDEGIPTTVIRWPVAFPAESVSGRFLSGFGVPDLLGGEGRYMYYTSAPVSEDDPAKNNVVEVSWNGESTQTAIEGPATGKKSHATLKLTVARSGTDGVRIDVEGAEPIQAVLEQWSDWVPVRFSAGLGKVHGQVKFLLMELEPHLRLVCSPIHMDPARQAFSFTWPADYGAELRERLGPFHTLGMPEQVHPLSHGRYGYDEFLAECEAVHQERKRMLEMELSRFQRGLLAFVFDTSDRMQHALWVTRDPDHPAYQEANVIQYAHVIPDLYREMDRVLGTVLEKVDEKTALMVLSDHGFHTFRWAVHVNRWLIENGYMNLIGGNAKDGRDILQDVDWSRTKAYAMGFASIYLNVAGREGKGIVEPENEYLPLCQEIADRLKEWKDPNSGEPVFHDVYIRSETYRGPVADQGPDLVLGLNPGYRASWQTALGGAPLALIEENRKPWSGDHLIDPKFVPGILFTNQKVQVSEPTLLDICPTVLHCFGIKPPEFVTGRPLF